MEKRKKLFGEDNFIMTARIIDDFIQGASNLDSDDMLLPN